MAFTNLWDQTFPADTQLANLLGADCRQLRVDTQQRMAAISGLDAVKPNFAADAQPASWNGILFFATDTGQIYQFNNPAWTNVTADFFSSTPTSVRNLTPATVVAPGLALTAGMTLAVNAGILAVGSLAQIKATIYCSVGATTPVTIGMSIAGNNLTFATLPTVQAVGFPDVINFDIIIIPLSAAAFVVYAIVGTTNGSAIQQWGAIRKQLAGNVTTAGFNIITYSQNGNGTGAVIFDYIALKVF